MGKDIKKQLSPEQTDEFIRILNQTGPCSIWSGGFFLVGLWSVKTAFVGKVLVDFGGRRGDKRCGSPPLYLVLTAH